MENYKENILQLKLEKETYKHKILEVTNNLNSLLCSLQKSFNKTSISDDQLKFLSIGELYTINDKIQFLKTYEDEQEIRFEAHIKKTNSLGIDCNHIKEIVLTNELDT